MFNYKVYFKGIETDREVAEFNTIRECKDYIFSQLNVNESLDLNNFYIYSLVG